MIPTVLGWALALIVTAIVIVVLAGVLLRLIDWAFR